MSWLYWLCSKITVFEISVNERVKRILFIKPPNSKQKYSDAFFFPENYIY